MQRLQTAIVFVMVVVGVVGMTAPAGALSPAADGGTASDIQTSTVMDHSNGNPPDDPGNDGGNRPPCIPPDNPGHGQPNCIPPDHANNPPCANQSNDQHCGDGNGRSGNGGNGGNGGSASANGGNGGGNGNSASGNGNGGGGSSGNAGNAAMATRGGPFILV